MYYTSIQTHNIYIYLHTHTHVRKSHFVSKQFRPEQRSNIVIHVLHKHTNTHTIYLYIHTHIYENLPVSQQFRTEQCSNKNGRKKHALKAETKKMKKLVNKHNKKLHFLYIWGPRNGFQRFLAPVYYWKTVEKSETEPQLLWEMEVYYVYIIKIRTHVIL
jgi:hypothetical protein